MTSRLVNVESGSGTTVSILIDSGKKYCGEMDCATVSIEAGGMNCGKVQG